MAYIFNDGLSDAAIIAVSSSHGFSREGGMVFCVYVGDYPFRSAHQGKASQETVDELLARGFVEYAPDAPTVGTGGDKVYMITPAGLEWRQARYHKIISKYSLVSL
jgi:hypothetical protein